MSPRVKTPRKFSGVIELQDGWWGLGRTDEFPTPEDFVAAFNRHMMLDGDDQVQVEEVERGWVRHMPDRSSRYDGRFITAKGPGPGAFEVWYIPEP